MTLKQIVECLRNNGFKVTGFSSAFSDSGREVCSHAYVYKGKTHVASISQYDKHISTICFNVILLPKPYLIYEYQIQ